MFDSSLDLHGWNFSDHGASIVRGALENVQVNVRDDGFIAARTYKAITSSGV
jgi:hypothetical protein